MFLEGHVVTLERVPRAICTLEGHMARVRAVLRSDVAPLSGHCGAPERVPRAICISVQSYCSRERSYCV